MAVVNVKVKHIRPQYNDLRQWMNDQNNVYIGRRGVVFVTDSAGNKVRWPQHDSPFANPFTIKEEAMRIVKINFPDALDDSNAVKQLMVRTDVQQLARANVLVRYEDYIIQRLNSDPGLYSQFVALKGKTLGCWCSPEPCHGDILLRLLTTVR